jgi:transcriptional regulator with XRE-family HTH domain
VDITTKRLRKLKGKMTLAEFSRLVGIGQSTLHNYLAGREMKLKMLKKICDATGCSPAWLLGYGEDKASDRATALALRCMFKGIKEDIEKILTITEDEA